ncbi:MAG TPA: nuclear transport factor 2 family protein, partial [Gemmatimonadaceae bacterium]
MKRFFMLALVIGIAQVAVTRAQNAPQSDVVKADEAITKALLGGDKAAAEKMLDADFSWIDPDGVYYATKSEAFAHGVKPLVGTGADVKILEHRYGKLVYVERSQGEKKFSGHFWAQRANGWKLLHINDLEVRPRDYEPVRITFDVPCV